MKQIARHIHWPAAWAGDRPLASLEGYRLSDVPRDILAGIVIAALTIPLCMGYANVIGIPEVYGLYASIVAPLAFALITGTRHVVFGMDSAVSAMTGTTLAALLMLLPGTDAISIMPILTLLVAAFLIIFAFVGVGKLVSYVPIPVMHGFIAGISLSIIVGQLPRLLGLGVSGGSSIGGLVTVFQNIGQTNFASLIMGVCSIALIFVLGYLTPRVPSSIVVLVLAAVVSALFGLEDYGVRMVEMGSSSLPPISFPSFSALGDSPSVRAIIELIFGAAAIAFVVSIESLLCLKTFSMKAGMRPHGSRELLSFGVSNAVVGLFGCPPCSASVSRTAAAISGGASSQVASVVASLVVGLVVLIFSPLLAFLPLPALSAIVIVAMIQVIDFSKISRYAKNIRLEMIVFLVSALVVFIWGAIVGVAVGIVVSLIIAWYRMHRKSQSALIGAVPRVATGTKAERKADAGVGSKRLRARDYPSVTVYKLEGNISFLNVNSKIDELLKQITPHTKSVIIKMSSLESLDVTATDELLQTVAMLHARGLHVKLVRKMRPANDSYTRHEMREIMNDARFYPSVHAALDSLRREGDLGARKGEKDKGKETDVQSNSNIQPAVSTGSAGDASSAPKRERHERPVFTILGVERVGQTGSKHNDIYKVSGKIALIVSGKRGLFDLRTDGKKVQSLTVRDTKSSRIIAKLEDGKWSNEKIGSEIEPVIEDLLRYAQTRLPELAQQASTQEDK